MTPKEAKEYYGATFPIEQTICKINDDILGFRLHTNGWCATFNGIPCPLEDIPASYRQLVRPAIKIACEENKLKDMSGWN